jgi:hypothetical protein
MNRSERRKHRTKDYGQLSVPTDPQREDRFVAHLLSQAGLPHNGGRARGEVEVKVPGPNGATRVGIRSLEVDLGANTLTVTESWDGRETARKSCRLDQLPSQQKPGLFAPRPPKREAGPVRPVRRPPDGLATHDPAAVQARILERAETEITTTGALAERIVLVCDHHLEELSVADARAVHRDGSALYTLAALAGRPGVNVRILMGELEPVGAVRTGFFLGILEGDPEGRFWFAKREFRILGGRIASRGSWDVSDGLHWGGDWHELPRHLRTPRAPWAWLPATSVPMPTLHCRLHTLPAPVTGPAEKFAAAAAGIQEYDAWTKGLDGTHVFAFRGREVEQFVVRGENPVGIDDLCRALAARGEPPDAMATMALGTFHDKQLDQITRAVFTIAEAGGQRYQRILAMHWAPGARPDDPCKEMRYWGSVPEDVSGRGWIGVAPVTELDLFPLSAGDA